MKLLVLTGYDDAYANVGDIGIPNKYRYCELRNYAFNIVREGFDTSRPASWSKILFVKERLPHYDWIFWTDADSLIMNHEVKLTRFIDSSYDFIMALENAGQFFIRNSEWSFKWLDAIWNSTEYIHHHWWENMAISMLKNAGKGNPWYPSIKNIPMHCEHFNTWIEHYKPGDFLLHFAGQEDRASLMNRYNNMPPLA